MYIYDISNLRVKVQVSDQYVTTGLITVLYIFILDIQ